MANFYNSSDWIKFRQVIINSRLNSNGETICEYCKKPIYKKYDIILHHINELNELTYQDANVALNPDNIMIVHHKCHCLIHNNLNKYTEHKNYIVYGPALSGKTTYVNEVSSHGDLVLDISNIWQCITNNSEEKPNGLKNLVFDIRDKIIEDIKQNRIFYKRAYIVGTYKLVPERDRLAAALNAELICIDTSKEECLERANKSKNKKEYIEYINEWFNLNAPPSN